MDRNRKIIYKKQYLDGFFWMTLDAVYADSPSATEFKKATEKSAAFLFPFDVATRDVDFLVHCVVSGS